MFCNYFWKDVGDSWDKDISAADASLDQAPQGLPAFQPRSAVHHDHTELPVLLERLTQNVVDQWWAENAGGAVTLEENVEGRWKF